MAKSRQDLIYRALRNLGVLPSGQNPSAEEYNSVADLVDVMVEDLIARNVYYLTDTDSIPDEVFMHLGLILAWCAAPEFGAGNDAAIAARSQKAEKDLKIISAVRYNYDPLEIEAF